MDEGCDMRFERNKSDARVAVAGYFKLSGANAAVALRVGER
jgi:hypothetical protein